MTEVAAGGTAIQGTRGKGVKPVVVVRCLLNGLPTWQDYDQVLGRLRYIVRT